MILVTGASGFLGQHLVRYLSTQGGPARALYNNNRPSTELAALPNIAWQQCDLLDMSAVEQALDGVDEVYHCAGIVSFNPRNRERMLHFNTEGTANIVNASLEKAIRKLVHVSSVAALGRKENNSREITEEEAWEESKHNSAYGLSKYMAEMEVWRGIGEGLNAVIVNPGIILGEGDWDNGSAQLMTTVNKEFPFYTSGINSWVGVDDVVVLMHALMKSDVAAERFIISAGNFSYREIFTMMAKALGKCPPHIHASPLMTGIVWRAAALKSLFTGKGTVITKETASNAQQLSYYNNDKIFTFFPDYRYMPVGDVIERMARSFKETYKKQ